MQPPNAEPRWSADRLWWWDGARWIPAGEAPVAPPPPPPPPPPIVPPPPPSYSYLPPAYPYAAQPASRSSSGLGVVLIVFLAVSIVLNGFMSVMGTIGVTGGNTTPTSIFLWLAFIVLFVISTAGLLGVVRKREWGRWVALAAGIALSVTLVGAVVGIPIIVAAARTPTGRSA